MLPTKISNINLVNLLTIPYGIIPYKLYKCYKSSINRGNNLIVDNLFK